MRTYSFFFIVFSFSLLQSELVEKKDYNFTDSLDIHQRDSLISTIKPLPFPGIHHSEECFITMNDTVFMKPLGKIALLSKIALSPDTILWISKIVSLHLKKVQIIIM
jgi:hypothetical protein